MSYDAFRYLLREDMFALTNAFNGLEWKVTGRRRLAIAERILGHT